ncbi:MAG: hypothetical protein QG670_1669 [Thermoproteota archaeon]|nr:hypothetical protein [Thermoproteota archaeon]
MRITVQTDKPEMLDEILKSNCDGIRLGSDFCEWKIPRLDALKNAFILTQKSKKTFAYVTPRLSNNSFKKAEEGLAFLNDSNEVEVVINDLGLLDILEKYPKLKPHLGRRLVFMPARCPWIDDTLKFRAGLFERKKLEELYYQTSLNYIPTINFFKRYGIRGVDVDWIPDSFPFFVLFIKNGLTTSVHAQLIPVTITRRCHTARYLSEKEPSTCSRPCNKRAFLLKQPIMKQELYLYGNTVFRLINPSSDDMKQLREGGAVELIITVNPITGMTSRERLDAFIDDLKKMT